MVQLIGGAERYQCRSLALIPRVSRATLPNENALLKLKIPSLPSVFLGDFDISNFTNRNRARAGVLPKVYAHRHERLVSGTNLVPPTAAMGLGMVFQDRN